MSPYKKQIQGSHYQKFKIQPSFTETNAGEKPLKTNNEPSP